MIDRQIARRCLSIVYTTGEKKSFYITIGLPFESEDGEYCCEVYSDEILFIGKQKAFGIDSIDALDYAIQTIDTATAEFKFGTICWPDGTLYKRVHSSRKKEWGP